MKNAPSYLGRALAISLALHAAVIAGGAQLAAPVPRIVPLSRSAQADLTVWFRDPPVELDVPAPPRPRLLLPRNSSRNANAAAAVVPKAAPTVRLTGEAAASAAEQLQRELPYPPEAIARGLQGEALVLLFLDAAGNVIAARIESSSGHALLDEAAVRAARSLRALPDSAPREALLPVRFRLR
jgi:protein TonB